MPPSSRSQSAAITALRKVRAASFSESSDCAKSHTGWWIFWGAVDPLTQTMWDASSIDLYCLPSLRV